MQDPFSDLDAAQQQPGPDPFTDLDNGGMADATKKESSPAAFPHIFLHAGINPKFIPTQMIGRPNEGVDMLQAGKGMALQGGGAAIGQQLGSMTGEFAPIAVPAFRAAGAGIGDIIDQYSRPGNQPFKWGELASAIGMGLIPGGSSMAKASAGQVIKQGAKLGAANVVLKNIETAIDQQRAANLSENLAAGGGGIIAAGLNKAMDAGMGAGSTEAAQNAAQSAGFISKAKQMKEAGLLVPSMANPATGLRDTPEVSALIKGANNREVEDAVVIANSQRAGELTREYAGLPPDAPLNQASFDAAAKPHLAIYEQIGGISPEAQQHLTEFMVARDNAKSLWQDANSPLQTNRTAMREAAKDAEITMQAKEFQLMNDAHMAGRPDLINQFAPAKQALARNYAAQNATDFVRGEVDPSLFTKMKARGVPLDGNADLLADSAEAAPKWMKPASSLNALRPAENMGTSSRFGKALALAGKTGAAGVGAMIGGPSGHAETGAVAGLAAASAAGPIKDALAQYAKGSLLKTAANPNYIGTPGAIDPEFLANLNRYLALTAGRQSPQPSSP